ncbi:MAG: hypothetical protein JO033_04010 [Acidobacteriaceae bacterium]|nr:hypothetical protein [Acidobacteriaceae bacterium]
MVELEVRGSLPQIIRNDQDLYEGNLIHYFQVIFNDASNLNKPYHNFRHMFHVLWLCYDACWFYTNELSRRDKRNLFIAAVFHDFDHLGRPGPDQLNIDRAIAGLRMHIAPEDVPHLATIEALIQSTHYPYTVASESLHLAARIIRDADAGQTLNAAWIQQVIFGLAAELGKTPLEVLEMQEPFLSNLRLATEWARTMFPKEHIEEKINEANELLSLLRKRPR